MEFLRKLYLIFIAAPTFILVTLLAALVTMLMTLTGRNRFWGYWPAHLWSRACCLLAWVKVDVNGRENIDKKSSYIFVCNHQGAFDIWAIYGYLDHNFKWLMKKSLEKIPFVGFACKRSGHVFVDTGSLQSIKHTIEDARHQLKDGMSLVIFPEGTRTKTGEMGEFKRGAFLLAAEFKLPVVPLSIDGAYDIMPKDSYFPGYGTIKLKIHKPIYPGERGFNTKELLGQCRDIISEDLKK